MTSFRSRRNPLPVRSRMWVRSQPGSDEAISSCTRVSVSRAGSTPGKVGSGHAQVLIHIGLHSIIDLCLVIVHVLTPGADDFHLRAAGRDVLAKSWQQQPCLLYTSDAADE